MPLGVVAAWSAGTLVDRAIMAFAVLGFSVPVFVIGYLLAYVFALGTRLAAGAGLSRRSRKVSGPWLENLVLPALALGASISR